MRSFCESHVDGDGEVDIAHTDNEREAEDDETPTLIKKVRADAPLLAHMESIQELKSEFLDGIDDIMGYMASCSYKRSNQPLDTDMYKKCFERLSCTRAFLENCYD